MKRFFIPLSILLISALVLVRCAKEFEYSPTYAVPLASGELSVAEIIGARESEVKGDTLDNDLVFYKLIYSDTIPSITLSRFSPDANGFVPAETKITLEQRKVDLKMTGKAESGEFHFTNPTVEFRFRNTIDMDFDLTLQNTYTENKSKVLGPDTFAFEIQNQPTRIEAGTSTSPGTGKLILSNADTSTNGALTSVFSPTPKFLYYTPHLEVPNGGTSSSGQIDINADVILPFQGHGTVVRRDTLFYSFKDSVFSVGGEGWGANAGMGDFALLRMNFENGLPLQVEITGQLYSDTSNIGPSTLLSNLPFYDGELNPQTTAVVVAGADQATVDPSGSPTTTPSLATTEVRLDRERVSTGIMNLDDLEEGKAIVLTMTFSTTDYDSGKEIKIYSDQTLKFNMGIRLNGEAKIERPKLKDLF